LGQATQAPAPQPTTIAANTNHIVPAPATPVATKNATYAGFVNFIAYDYEKLILYVAYILLFMVSIALLINILTNVDLPRNKLILRALVLLCIISLVPLLNQHTILHFIPHQVII